MSLTIKFSDLDVFDPRPSSVFEVSIPILELGSGVFEKAPTITAAGRNLFAMNAASTFVMSGFSIALGTGLYEPEGDETALQTEVVRISAADASIVANDQIRISATLGNGAANGAKIGEVGIYYGATLVAILSKPSTPMFAKIANVDIPLKFTVDISVVETASIPDLFPLYKGALAASSGAGLVGFSHAQSYPAGTLGEKAKHDVSVTDVPYNAVEDGTDQTAKILAMFTLLGAAFEGMIRIPYGVKFNFTQVAAAAPLKAIIKDDSAINAWDNAGFRQRTIGYWEKGDPTAIVDLQQILSSGHNACFILDNRGTAGSNSAAGGVAAVVWSRGRLTKVVGQEGIRQLARVEFAKIDGQNKWQYILRRGVPWAANNWEYWYSGNSYAVGDCVINDPGGVYQATTAGVTGATPPTHAKGTTVSDGGVSWLCINNSLDDGIFSVDQYGQIATNTTPLDGVAAYFKGSRESNGSASVFVEGNGPSKATDFRLRPTDAAGAVVPIPLFTAQADVGMRLVASDFGHTMFKANDARGLELGVYGHTETVAPDASATPSVADCGTLIMSNTVATNVTGLTGGRPTQEVTLFFTTANTTLVHSALFALKGAANVTPPANSMIVMKRVSISAAWFQKS